MTLLTATVIDEFKLIIFRFATLIFVQQLPAVAAVFIT